jgi:hypothetical protein
MGAPDRKPARSSSAKPPGSSRAAAGRRRARVNRACELVDFAVTRLLVLVVVVAIARGQVTREVVAAIWASYCVLRNPPRRR